MFNKIKPVGRLILGFLGFFYDFYRYCRFSGAMSNYNNRATRNYAVAKVYHSLEKSLSFKERRSGAGAGEANLLCELLEFSLLNKDFGYHDRVGFEVLSKFIDESDGLDSGVVERCEGVLNNYQDISCFEDYDCGSITRTKADISKGILEIPEDFFNTRYSLREYSSEVVSIELVNRAVALAMKTPSACNRQPWHVYQIDERKKIDLALSFQSGNRGFGHKVPYLMIITMDLRAFVPGSERYQHWIDGGMFSMSIIYALHSLGLASCCLNWSKLAKDDKKLREALGLKDEHSIMMMLSVGYPDELNKLCVSPRRPFDEIITKI
jgi:nitroreductase